MDVDCEPMAKDKELPRLESRMCFNAYKLNRAFARFYQSVFGETGLTYPKYVILSVLSDHGAQSVSELSERAGVETNTLSPLLKRMADYGVISRSRDPHDERRVVLRLTEMGVDALALASEAIAREFECLGFDPDKVLATIDFMTDMQDKLAASEPNPIEFKPPHSRRK